MGNRATYGCTALLGTNKSGTLKPNSEGYYPLVLGAFDIFNSSGAYYPLGPAKEAFEESGSLMRRIRNGSLRGEYGHPKRLPGMTDRDFLERVLTIDEKCICAFFKEVTLVDGVKGPNNTSVVAVIGQTKPSGPHASSLQASLEDNNENVCFSVRAITNDEVVGSQRTKNIKTIITWDYVNEPGIAIANKFSAPTLEYLNELSFSLEQIKAIEVKNKSKGIMMESSPLVISAKEIEAIMGWKSNSISAKTPLLKW